MVVLRENNRSVYRGSVFKRKKRKGEPYVIQYTDEHGKRQTVKGLTDKGLTERLASKLENEVVLRKRGMIDPVQAKIADEKSRPLAEHLNSFERVLNGRDNTPKHVRQTMRRIRRITEGCEFATISAVSRHAVETFLIDMCEAEDLGPKTYNHYLQAIDSFFNWCVSSDRILSNPISGIPRRNPELDVRHPRRALTPDELRRLIDSARNSRKSIQCFSGEQRARLYTLSFMTGLRKNEIASLSPSSFSLDSEPPTMVVEATISKHREKDTLPIHAELAAMVREWQNGVPKKRKLFPGLAGKKTWLMVRKDLERVGIPYRTDEGIADFHAAGRHTHITELLRSGATLPETQKLARHSEIKMTMKYAHIGLQDQANAVNALKAPGMSEKTSDAALQMRCISGVSNSPSLTSADKEDTKKCNPNPCDKRSLGATGQRMSQHDKMEAAGIEPLYPQS